MLDRINYVAMEAMLGFAGGVKNLRTRQEGQTMAEYAVVLTVITVALIAAFGVLSGNIDSVLRKIAERIKVA